MDSLITAAARALRSGDPLGALKRIALRNDAPALALRGIAMAQLGELAKARVLMRRAARSFGPRERVERARCVTAEAEVELAPRPGAGWVFAEPRPHEPDEVLAMGMLTLAVGSMASRKTAAGYR